MNPSRYGPFPYSPIVGRPPLHWPNGARIAVWVVVNVEFFPLDNVMPGDNAERPRGTEKLPMVREWAQRDYGNRVGIFRVMEVLERYGIKASTALNSDVCEQLPSLVKEIVQRGWEIMGHNRRNTERLNEVALDAEGALVREACETLKSVAGKRPTGWLSAGNAETWNTLEHLIDNGIRYVCDWLNDDQPYRMNVGGREIVAIPYTADANDNHAFTRHKATPAEFEQLIRDQFDQLYREGERVMAIAVHPHLIGQPFRISALDRALAYINGFPNVWKATGSEIVEHYLATQSPIDA